MNTTLSFLKSILLCSVTIGCLLGLESKVARGAVMLSLQVNGAVDLSNLSLGQTFTVEVFLSGLQPAEELNFLAGSVSFNSDLLGSATNVAASTIADGGIVPDIDGFLGFGIDGLADGNYDVLFSLTGSPITTNGRLYSFDVTPLRAGSGQIEMDNMSLAARDAMDIEVPIEAGIALRYTINGDPPIVPEPSSWIVLTVLALASVRRRRELADRFKQPSSSLAGVWTS